MANGMPMPSGPEMDPSAAAAPAQEESSINPKQLVSGIHTQMMALMDLMDKTPAITPEDKQAFGQIIQQYQSFVNENLGSASQGGASPPSSPSAPGNVSVEAGSNPNARPM